jgi:hypothetical protein
MNSHTRSHREVWEAIPWILNGSVSQAEAHSMQEHLRVCADCREALAFERRVREAIGQPQVNVSDAEPGWQQLCARLDDPSADKQPLPIEDRSARMLRSRRSPSAPVRWLAAAVIVEALALGASVTASWSNHRPPETVAVYRTLSQADAVTHAPTIRVVLAPSVTLEQFGNLLHAAHLQVVAGPSKAGVWSLAPADDAPSVATEAALRELRGSPQVQFAEPLESAARAQGQPQSP